MNGTNDLLEISKDDQSSRLVGMIWSRLPTSISGKSVAFGLREPFRRVNTHSGRIIYLKCEFFDADSLPEPGKCGVDEGQGSEEGDEVGGDVCDERNGVRRTRRHRLDDVRLLAGNNSSPSI